MSGRLRVFLVASNGEQLAAFRTRIEQHGALEIAGQALEEELRTGGAIVPAGVEAVLRPPLPSAPPARLPPRSSRLTTPADEPLVEQLTPRERSVLALAADGLPNREIAHELEISEHTVKFHLASVFGKLGASSRTEAVRRGLQLGLIEI
jgi:DNA-binding NarL/FixJ family response regulator